MKISPMAQGTGAPGQVLGNVEIGRTADPIKMERARAIARGEAPQEPLADAQAERVRQSVRSIRMRVNRTTGREEEYQEAPPAALPQNPANAAAIEPQSSTLDSVEPKADEVTQPLSPQLAALARQKRALQVKERELQEKEKAFNERGAQGDADGFKARLKSEPLSVLQEHGILDSPEFYNALTERILAGQGGINPEIEALKAKIESLEKGVDQKLSDREVQAEEAALTEMLYEAESLAKEGDAFEMIRERNAYDKVLRLIHGTYKKTGRVLDVSEAMNKVENDLLVEAERIARIKKVQGKLAPTPPALPLQPQKQMRTLTARDSSVAPMSAKARAMAAFNGTLRK